MTAPSNGPIHYSFGQIEAMQQQIISLQGEMDRKLADIKRTVDKMIVDWDASSSTSYQEHQAKWDTAASELHQVLEAVGRVVGQGNEGMQEANAAAARSWG
ncbi:WXG100 family type VII secretion target [Prescottella agglutinans]|uniref:ESAT-6-like protein n=1 Tax=Prescottella agglutinans TaxID=1644129 RepID=A0A3S3AYI3_9NOCA|nr:WXG100 family type VII secretion target [Prescottella agglutinans]RVW11562.1 WXG100 family type VII secretion target [Prescottella agglutinans]